MLSAVLGIDWFSCRIRKRAGKGLKCVFALCLLRFTDVPPHLMCCAVCWVRVKADTTVAIDSWVRRWIRTVLLRQHVVLLEVNLLQQIMQQEFQLTEL